MEDLLSKTAVLTALNTKWIGHRLHYYETIGSTNDVLKEMLTQGDGQEPPAGTLLLTEYQSQGRGRLDRRWEIPPRTSLLMSLLFRPGWPAERGTWLTMIMGLTAVEAIQAVAGIEAALKWPNDILLNVSGAWHKVGGILLESNLDGEGRLESVVLGMGVNVNVPLEQLPQARMPATSLFAATGNLVSRLDLLVDFLKRLEGWYETAVGGQSPQPAWNKRLVTIGQSVTVSFGTDQPTISGIAEGTDAWGQLLVRDDQGQQHTITAGDVSLKSN